jgi:tRNA pseudouridine13 synthase
MKLKQDPDDFQVEELTDVRAGPDGPFAFYRLAKRGWSTPDALSAIRRRWQLTMDRLQWGGLKDRHAATTQFVSIFRGPQRNFEQPNIHLEYLGQIHEPYSAAAIAGNRFQICVRHLTDAQIQAALSSIEVVNRDGVPNYFDDQRFGSVGNEPDFIARRMIRGEFEDALRLALAEPYPYDRAIIKREKSILREHWGRWAECKPLLPRGHARSLVDYLVHHPTDYRGAVARLRPDLQGLFLAAYQSYLWNAIFGAWIAESFAADELLPLELRLGNTPAPKSLNDEQCAKWHSANLPLPAARWRLDPSAEYAPAAQRILAVEGFAWEDIKIKGLRKPFFTKGERATWCIPADLAAEPGDDERNAGRSKLTLKFVLPRGSYATLVVKRLLAGH